MSEENERDAGFCSGEDLEDPLEAEDDLHSPTDVSEDSVEVKVLPISLRNIKNKRKCAEPRKVASEDDDVLPPYKKRRHFVDTDAAPKKPSPILQDEVPAPPRPSSVTSLPGVANPASPFRPWSQGADQRRCTVGTPSPPPTTPRRCQSATVTSPPEVLPPYNDRVPSLPHQQEEPLSLVLKSTPVDGRSPQRRDRPEPRLFGVSPPRFPSSAVIHPAVSEPLVRYHPTGVVRTQRFEAVDFSGPASTPRRTLSECTEVEDLSGGLKPRTGAQFSVESLLGGAKPQDPKPGPSSEKHKQTSPGGAGGGQQRNYKNMTRERRIEANARERTRVHTISAAFDTLRRAIPAYSHNQKLSKLSVLRIACSYILTLSRVAGADYSADGSEPSLSECVDLVSRTIQTEGKLRRKKED
ncbi:uncharacterized protein net [Periplaneta americana]|uniref:uncharacterized protein net n=1 Tax=Periplaneta americana TaxID=6978 RepID=UPI0037E840AF